MEGKTVQANRSRAAAVRVVNGGLKHDGDNAAVNSSPCTAGDMDVEWRLTSELIFGAKKSMKGECGYNLTPVIRVCNEGFDVGRRFQSCPYEGVHSCGYLRWLDDEWQGRSRVVIHKLADDNKNLQVALFEKEQAIQRMKQERNNQVQQRKRREK